MRSEHIKEHERDNGPYASESHTPNSDITYMAQDEMGRSNGNAN